MTITHPNMRAILVLGSVLLSGPAAASGLLLCNSAAKDIASFVTQRVEPVAALEEKTSSERWAAEFLADRDRNERKLQAYCQSRPQTTLWLAFSEVFDTD